MLNVDWILLADRSRANILHALPDGLQPFPTIVSLIHGEGRLHPQDRDSDAAGRIQLQSGARSATEPHEDRRHVEARVFAKQIVEYLEQASRDRRFDRLFVVAPPEFLGVLRETWPHLLHRKIVREVNANLTQLPQAELQTRLAEIVGTVGAISDVNPT
ncbi:MAG: host attachment protein [Planctomycetaceae bacterium]|nr:host attachment protein [Planctomycetaceae bacterium]